MKRITIATVIPPSFRYICRYLTPSLFIILQLALLSSCREKKSAAPETSTRPAPLTVTPRIVGTLPHDSTAFTQGLFFHNGTLYESTGLYGQSELRTIDTGTGNILRSNRLDPSFFGEGCAFMHENIFQITWKEQTCIVYGLNPLTPVKTIFYSGEGWGLCSNPSKSTFYMSSGTDTITVRSGDFSLTQKIAVTLSDRKLTNLNELEFANGLLYANVWYSDFIFEISIRHGTVRRIIDCSTIVALEHPSSDQAVLNGIAYNKQNGQFYITGKRWKTIFIVTW